nr:MAG TPA: hypothetical protein [Caudoviricetes sp.]
MIFKCPGFGSNLGRGQQIPLLTTYLLCFQRGRYWVKSPYWDSRICRKIPESKPEKFVNFTNLPFGGIKCQR